MEDLWGFSNLNREDIDSMPQGIIKKQAELFEKKTKGSLFIKIATRKLTIKADDTYGLATNFEIIAPYLDGYSYTLFTMYSMPEKDYPVTIMLNSNKWEEVFDTFDYECKDEEEFKEALREILGSVNTTKVVKNLYSKSFLEE